MKDPSKDDLNLFGDTSRDEKDGNDSFKFGEYMPTLGNTSRSSKQEQFRKTTTSFSIEDDLENFVSSNKTSSSQQPKTSNSNTLPKTGTNKNELDFDMDFQSLLKPRAAPATNQSTTN